MAENIIYVVPCILLLFGMFSDIAWNVLTFGFHVRKLLRMTHIWVIPLNRALKCDMDKELKTLQIIAENIPNDSIIHIHMNIYMFYICQSWKPTT